MIISFTGTRKGMTSFQIKEFGKLLYELGCAKLIHGDCIGADANAHSVAMALGAEVDKHPCNIKTQRAFTDGGKVVAEPLPPLERNKNIVDSSDILLGCPSTHQEELRSGTWATIRHAKRTKKPLIIIWPDGTTTWY